MNRLLTRNVLGQQRADDLFAPLIVALADVNVAKLAGFVNKVYRWPVLISIGLPGAKVIVNGDRIRHAQTGDGVLDVVQVLFIVELGAVNADDDQALVFVLGIPFLHRRNHMDAVDSAKRPKVNHDHLAAQIRQLERRRVEPDLIG